MFVQERGLSKHFLTLRARQSCSDMSPFYVCFQVAQHAEDVPTIRTGEYFFCTVSLLVAFQKLCSPKGLVTSVALEISFSFSVDFLVVL